MWNQKHVQPFLEIIYNVKNPAIKKIWYNKKVIDMVNKSHLQLKKCILK